MRRLGERVAAWRRRFVPRLRRSLPTGPKHWASVALVWLVTLAWFWSWCRGNWAPLFDPNVLPNDASTAIFPFHRYAEGAPLSDDPIANEMLEYQPYAYRLLFRVTVPFIGLLAAAKVVQWLLILIVIAAGVVLMTSRRAGLGAGLLFAFLFLHDAGVQGRVIGGLPRGFGFPLAALWLAGALACRPWVRRCAALIAALTYPTALAMVLGAEGVYSLRGMLRPGLATLLRRLKHYALLVVACCALLAPAVLVGMADGGPIHTLDQARAEPAFGETGRLDILPFAQPGRAFGSAYLSIFTQAGTSPFSSLRQRLETYEAEIGVIGTALLFALVLFRVSPTPGPVIAFLISSLVVYAASRVYAFRLYSPERYYSVGMRAVGLAFAAAALGFVGPRLRYGLRQPVRNVVVAAAIFCAWVALGNGVGKPPMGLTVNYRHEAPLWRFIEALPRDARIASHIMDGDTIPLFTARANNGAYETLQPWLTLSWARQKARSEDTLRALYATKREDVILYAKKYRVSHLLLSKYRYSDDFYKRSRSFEPFTRFARNLLKDKQRADLVLAAVPDDAVVFRFRQWQLVSVEKLEAAWKEP
jgi:hypothetical protein